jgi:hypothetical protein
MDSVIGLRFDRFGYHPLQQDFQSHGMSATVMCQVKLAIAVVHTVFKSYMMVIVIAVKRDLKLVEEEPIFLLRVAFCLFSFAYHSIVHRCISFQDGNKKSTQRRVLFSLVPD